MFSISQPCSRCGGRGTVIDDPCPTCGGTRRDHADEALPRQGPAGVRDGSRIRLAGKGEPGLGGGPPGDLYVVTRVAPSPVFKRKGDNLEVEVPISIVEAVRGGTVEVPTLERDEADPHSARARRTAAVQRLRGEGPPKLSGSGRGDIHYRFRIDDPEVAERGAARGGRAARRGDERRPARRAARSARRARS